MTTFNRLKTMRDTDIQNWLRKVGQKNVIPLGIALAGADEEVTDCVLRNMSDRARSILAQDIEKNKKMNFKEQDIAANAAKLEKLL